MLSFNEYKQLNEAAVPKIIRTKSGGTAYSSAQGSGPGIIHDKQKVAVNTFGLTDISFLERVPKQSSGRPVVPGIVIAIAWAIQSKLTLDQAIELVAGYIVTHAKSKLLVKQYYQYFTGITEEENTVAVKKANILKGVKAVPTFDEYLDYAVKHPDQ